MVFTAEIPTDKEFSSWTVRDDKDRDVTDKISLITPTLTAPVAEEDLGEEAEIVFNTIEGKTFKIKAKGKGACYVYVFAHNGQGRNVNVRVTG